RRVRRLRNFSGLVRRTINAGNHDATFSLARDLLSEMRSVHFRSRAIMIRTLIRPALVAALLTLLPFAAPAADCPGNPDALRAARVLTVDPAATPAVGRKHFPVTLPLEPKEVVLTFDDGPWPGTTDAVLAALRHECVKASFFMLGRNAAAHPALARKVLADGHTVAYHTYSHPLLNRMSVPRAAAEIEHGIAAVDQAVYGSSSGT